MAFGMLFAQQTFTEHLCSDSGRRGRVTLRQDATIERLVNGNNYASTSSATEPGVTTGQQDTTQHDSTQIDQRMWARKKLTNGYRIQVYAGGNNRKSKTEAYHVAGLVHTYFDDVPVYTHFVSPRWICRVGDCRTIVEGYELMQRLTQTGKFPEATIVKTKIIVYL